jgi:hypothetical protein
MKETPRYVLEAVDALIDRKEGRFLAEMVDNGVPLLEYPESRRVISKLLKGESIRGRGRPKQRSMTYDEDRLVAAVATQVGAGVMAYSNGENIGPTACGNIAAAYNVSESKVQKLWRKHKDSDWSKTHIELGGLYPQAADLSYREE